MIIFMLFIRNSVPTPGGDMFDVFAKGTSNDDRLLPWTKFTSPIPISYSTEFYETVTADLTLHSVPEIFVVHHGGRKWAVRNERRINVGREWESRV